MLSLNPAASYIFKVKTFLRVTVRSQHSQLICLGEGLSSLSAFPSNDVLSILQMLDATKSGTFSY